MRAKFSLLVLVSIITVQACGQTGQFSIKDKSEAEIKSLRESGVRKILVLNNGCSGCEIEFNKSGCECKDEGIYETAIFYQANEGVYLKTITCCDVSVPQEITDTFFVHLENLDKALQKHPMEKHKFYPPIPTHADFFSITYCKANQKMFSFAIYKNQLKEGSDDAKAWDKYQFFIEQKKIFSYLKSFLVNDISNSH